MYFFSSAEFVTLCGGKRKKKEKKNFLGNEKNKKKKKENSSRKKKTTPRQRAKSLENWLQERTIRVRSNRERERQQRDSICAYVCCIDKYY